MIEALLFPGSSRQAHVSRSSREQAQCLLSRGYASAAFCSSLHLAAFLPIPQAEQVICSDSVYFVNCARTCIPHRQVAIWASQQLEHKAELLDIASYTNYFHQLSTVLNATRP
jgi:hypothetical protein